MSFYELRIVDRSGNVTTAFEVGGRQQATIESVTWALNEPGSVVFSLPVHLAAAQQVTPLVDEVQVWRNGTMIFWGVCLQRDYSDGAVRWTCPGLLWYFTQLYFGPISIEHLTNPLFASNLTGWTAVGCTATHSTAQRIRGPGTARLVATSSGDNYLQQQLVVSTGSIGLLVTFAAWFWIDPNVAFTAPAVEERGLYVHATNGASEGNWEPITMNTPTGEWQRLETGVQLTPNLRDEVVTVRLYAPHGAVHWGATSGTEQESVSNNPLGGDVTEMMRKMVDYAQNGRGKFNLNIGTSTPASGVSEVKTYQFFDLANIFEMLQTYPERNLADFKVVTTSTTRTFTTYAPRKGSVKAYTATVPGPGVHVMRERIDGESTKTQVVRLGAGEGSDRETGVATDTAALGGLVLQSVEAAPPEVNVDGLNSYAAADLARLKVPVQIPEFTVPAEGFLGVVEEGDTIHCAVEWGAVAETLDRRVVAFTLQPKPDEVQVVVNVPTVPTDPAATSTPGAPPAVTATAGAGQITVAWTTPAFTGNTPITGYQVTVRRDSDTVVVSGPTSVAASPATITGLAAGVAVYAKVAAVNAVGVGPQSAASNVVTPT